MTGYAFVDCQHEEDFLTVVNDGPVLTISCYEEDTSGCVVLDENTVRSLVRRLNLWLEEREPK